MNMQEGDSKSINFEESQLILVYYNVRGKLQSIRYLLAVLDLPYLELHMQQRANWGPLNESVRTVLKDLPIDSAHLPLLLHEEYKIYDVYPIMNYLCKRFNREELMGKGAKQKVSFDVIKAQLVEIFVHYMLK